jgi:hypothetical protein
MTGDLLSKWEEYFQKATEWNEKYGTLKISQTADGKLFRWVVYSTKENSCSNIKLSRDSHVLMTNVSNDSKIWALNPLPLYCLYGVVRSVQPLVAESGQVVKPSLGPLVERPKP